MWDGYEAVPLPPPWRLLASGQYANEITGEESNAHPFLRLIAGDNKSAAPEEEDGQSGTPGRPYLGSDTVAVAPASAAGKPQKLKHWDFRCTWKELGLFGNVNSYGLTVRYYEDGQTVVNFDGLDGRWHFSQLDGPHGPLDRYDLFVGAKIQIFGRHLTIAATNASTCQWIDEEGRRLLKRQDWLQSKIESVGAVPVVRRPTPTGIKGNFGKKANSGNADLRRISNDNKKLGEQLAGLGMARIALEGGH